MILIAQSRPTNAGVKNFRVICGYSMFDEPHCGQRMIAAAMSGSLDSHSIIKFWARSKSASSTMILALAFVVNVGRDARFLEALLQSLRFGRLVKCRDRHHTINLPLSLQPSSNI